MPVLLTPAGDQANPLVALFVHERDPSRVDLTFVWRDEDHPVPALDLAYDAFRWVRYRRVADVETSWVRRDPATGQPLALVLPGTFGGDQPWNALVVRHLEVEVPWDRLERDPDGRPRLWVSTWNHLFTTTRPREAEWIETRDLPLKRGNREECQALYDRAWRGE